MHSLKVTQILGGQTGIIECTAHDNCIAGMLQVHVLGCSYHLLYDGPVNFQFSGWLHHGANRKMGQQDRREYKKSLFFNLFFSPGILAALGKNTFILLWPAQLIHANTGVHACCLCGLLLHTRSMTRSS
jgi:hypothetical protein